MTLVHIILFLALSVSCIMSTMLGEFQQACPYTNFCTIPSLRTFNGSDDVTPCCYDCFCDEDCWAYGDCCPDLDVNYTSSRGLSVKLECKPAYVENQYVSSQLDSDVSALFRKRVTFFRTIDFCPDGYNTSQGIQQKCTGNTDVIPEFDDVVLVSDGNSRVFKNKHCALCHGVSGFKRVEEETGAISTIRANWKMRLQNCKDELENRQLKLSESTAYILNNCYLTFERPHDVPRNGRTLPCDLITCQAPESSSFNELCINGPHMPYTFPSYSGILRVYKNVMCFKCLDNETHICPVAEPTLQKYPSKTYKMYIDPLGITDGTGIQKNRTNEGCGEDEIYDPFKNACRQMLCPPFEAASYGICTKLSNDISNFHVRVQIYFTYAEKKNITRGPMRNTVYNETLSRNYLKILIQKFGFSNCEIYLYDAAAWYDTASTNFVAIIVGIDFVITDSCTLNELGDKIRKTGNRKIAIPWVLNDEIFKMDGHVAFFGMPQMTDKRYIHDYLLLNSIPKAMIFPVDAFFTCPYLVINFNEYKMRVERNGGHLNESRLSINTKIYPGFYALSDTKLAICVDNLETKEQGSNYGHSLEFGLVMTITISCIISVIHFV